MVMLLVCDSLYLLEKDLVTFLKLAAHVYAEQLKSHKNHFSCIFEILACNL